VARTRPGSDRPLRFTETDDPDDPDKDDDQDDGQANGAPPTSLDDLTSEADPQQFDRTFLAGDADLTIQGRFDPVAGNRQVIPRVAYVINYNMVYNESRDRWEPKKKDRFQVRGFRTTSQTIPANTSDPLTVQSTRGRDNDRVPTPTTSIPVPRDGQYIIAASVVLKSVPDDGDVNTFITLNGEFLVEGGNADSTSSGDLGGGAATVADLAAGDALGILISNNTGSSIETVPNSHASTLAVGQL